MDSVYLYDKYGSPIGYDAWTNIVRLMDWVCANWRRPDEGIWEVRGGRQEFLYSRVMCWVAVDRAIRLATKRSFPPPGALVRDAGHDLPGRLHPLLGPDAARVHPARRRHHARRRALLMPLVRFVSPTDPRWISTLRAIERELVSDSLVYRYRLAGGFSDGLTGEEGTFSMCSFWYVECLSRMGDLHKARFFFEKMLGYANHLGLYGEELGPRRSTSATFRRRSRTWRSSAPPSISTAGSRPPATPGDRHPPRLMRWSPATAHASNRVPVVSPQRATIRRPPAWTTAAMAFIRLSGRLARVRSPPPLKRASLRSPTVGAKTKQGAPHGVSRALL
jgi:hypothetical protein